MKAIAVQIEGCAKVVGLHEFDSKKKAIHELRDVWGLSNVQKPKNMYVGWVRSADGPKHVCYQVFSTSEWEKVMHAYHR